MPARIAANLVMPFSPPQIFAVLASPQGQVAIDGSNMLVRALHEHELTKVGNTFVIAMFYPPSGPYQIRNEVTLFERDKALEWCAFSLGGGYGINFGYELSPRGESTDVLSYCDWSALPAHVAFRSGLPFISTGQLAATLDNLQAYLSRATRR